MCLFVFFGDNMCGFLMGDDNCIIIYLLVMRCSYIWICATYVQKPPDCSVVLMHSAYNYIYIYIYNFVFLYNLLFFNV